MKKLLCIFCFLLISSCDSGLSTSTPAHERYRSEFDPKRINNVESVLDRIAVNWKLTIFRKDREDMKFLSGDIDAFYSSFYFKDKCILTISSVGVPTKLSIMSIDHNLDKFSTSELERLTNVVLQKIENITSYKFVQNFD